ncbi:MAG TPA: tetratricopeptide repeat protein [Bacteroidales bacterium]|nr:tetratricopeptide repeat protein [Bacteroidales bacterium]HPJ59540.1 tetratricopeptide repeat protein [Bacteroidales bacterium]HPR12077.1 tetratricopeptide repeat protein [Bacteroidales bacterium]HRW86197.1 tetratricopeptide repeat protein [Bacteroidales bacterium]
MEEDKFGLQWEDEINQAVQKFERMRKNNESYFFDVVEFESIIDYYIENNNSVKAYEAAALASKQHPYSVSLQLRKAKVLLEKGRAVEALGILKQLESIEPGNHEIFIAKGTAMGILGDIHGARRMFDYALSLDYDDIAGILFSIVSVLQNLNYYDHLIPYLLRLIELEPDFQSHLYDLAYAYEKTEDYANSINYYIKYLEEEPFSDSAWYNLGIIYNKIDQPEKALEAYDYALAVNNQNSFALFNKANILSNLERYFEAIPVYHEYLGLEPDSFEALNYLGECYEKTGDVILAKQYYHDAIEIAPEYAEPWFGLGVVELKTGNPDDSIIFFRKAVRLDDENPEYWYFMGKAHHAGGELKSSVTCFREALKLDPYFDEVWLDFAKIILSENLEKKALPYLDHACKATGEVPGLNYLLASFHLKSGNADKAFTHLSLALGIDHGLFIVYRELFPREILSRKIIRLLIRYKLI